MCNTRMPLYTHIITYVSLSLYLSVSLDISISICTSLSLLHSTSKLTHPRPSENSIPATGVIQIALLQSDNASGTLGPNLQWWFKIPEKNAVFENPMINPLTRNGLDKDILVGG